jgi:hypothetical protein
MHRWTVVRVGPNLTPIRMCEDCGLKPQQDDLVFPDCDSFRRETRHRFDVGDECAEPHELIGWIRVTCRNCGLRTGIEKGRDPVEYAKMLHGEVGTCEQKKAVDVSQIMDA